MRLNDRDHCAPSLHAGAPDPGAAVAAAAPLIRVIMMIIISDNSVALATGTQRDYDGHHHGLGLRVGDGCVL